MPIYEYRCSHCNKEFELMRPFSEANKPGYCPECHSQGERLLSVFASTADFSIKVPDKQPFRKKRKKK